MKIARYWEKQTAKGSDRGGKYIEATCWGWSANDVNEARQRAGESAKRLLSLLISGDLAALPHGYGYDQRPPREEIIDEIADSGGETHATVTRNSYGCLVLNTRDLMFIDVDFPYRPPTVPLPRFVRKLLGQPDPPNDDQIDDRSDVSLEQIGCLIGGNPQR